MPLDNTDVNANGSKPYQKAPFHGLGAMRWKNGKMSLIAAVLDYADLKGDPDVEARKVIAAMRAMGTTGWSPAKLTVARIKATFRKIEQRIRDGERIVPPEERRGVQPDYEAAARAYREKRKPSQAANTAASGAGLVTRLENLRTALELALEEVKGLLE